MKTFTANEFTREPQRVYREADTKGEVKINHSHYSDKIFILTSRERKPVDGK